MKEWSESKRDTKKFDYEVEAFWMETAEKRNNLKELWKRTKKREEPMSNYTPPPKLKKTSRTQEPLEWESFLQGLYLRHAYRDTRGLRWLSHLRFL